MGYRYALFQINATYCDACFGTVNLVVSVDSVWSTITPALAIFFSLLVQFDELVLKLTSLADFNIALKYLCPIDGNYVLFVAVFDFRISTR